MEQAMTQVTNAQPSVEATTVLQKNKGTNQNEPSAPLATGSDKVPKRTSTGDIIAYLATDSHPEVLEQCYALSWFLRDAFFSREFRTRPDWAECIVPSEAGSILLEKDFGSFAKEDL